MRIHIAGKVVDDMVEEGNSARYHIRADGTEYEVVARGGQAFKDYLFVRKNQQMEIEGILKAKRIYLEKAKIRLKEKKERQSKAENKALTGETGVEEAGSAERTDEGSKKDEGAKGTD